MNSKCKMKINEKTLLSYATSSAPCDREGELLKRGEVNKSFQRRWFVLRGNLLFYFEKKSDKEPLGVIVLEGCTIELAEDEKDVYAFKVVFHGDGKPGRVYVFGTSSQEDMEAWMRLLACSSYDYMKLMVIELESQLAELEETERLAAASKGSTASIIADNSRPKVPPRNRQNPFNEGTIKTTKEAKSRRFLELHRQFGIRILADRGDWKRNRKVAEIHMEDDTLVVTM